MNLSKATSSFFILTIYYSSSACLAALVSPSDLERMLGCPAFTVLNSTAEEEEMQSADSTISSSFVCAPYLDIRARLNRNDGDVERVIQETGVVVDVQEPALTHRAEIERRQKRCLSASVNGVWADPQEVYQWGCTVTTYQCIFDKGEDIKNRRVGGGKAAPVTTPDTSSRRSARDEREADTKYITADRSCLREVISSVADFHAAYKAQLRRFAQETVIISDTCREQTQTLQANQEIQAAFSSIQTDTRRVTLNGVETEFVEYLNVSASTYANDCSINGGVFVEIDFRATCRNLIRDGAFRFQNVKVPLIVASRPRCYGVDCALDDELGLFERYTLQETERLWSEQMPGALGIPWSCQGQLEEKTSENEADFGICSVETVAIGEEDAIRATQRTVVPLIELNQRNFIVFSVDISDEKVVTFPRDTSATGNFQDACARNAGNFTIVDDCRLACNSRRRGTGGGAGTRRGSTAEESLTLDVSGFSTCLSTACDDPEQRVLLQRTLLVNRLLDAGALAASDDLEWTCVSGATHLLVMAPMLLTFLTVLSADGWFI